MKRFIALLALLVLLVAPIMTFADPAPDDDSTQSVSPIVLEISSDFSSE